MVKKIVALTLLFLIICVESFKAQKANSRKLEKPEKRWIIKHPVAAVSVRKRLARCYPLIEKVKTENRLDQFENGGCLDAFRHVFTMAFLAQRIPVSKLRTLGIAHEKSNRIQFEKRILEDSEMPDSVSCQMDLLNNEIGFHLGKKNINTDMDSLVEVVINEIQHEGAWQIARSQKGNYLSCDGKELELGEWNGKWNIPKCLIKSGNYCKGIN